MKVRMKASVCVCVWGGVTADDINNRMSSEQQQQPGQLSWDWWEEEGGLQGQRIVTAS